MWAKCRNVEIIGTYNNHYVSKSKIYDFCLREALVCEYKRIKVAAICSVKPTEQQY
jgi:hypothetical protein